MKPLIIVLSILLSAQRYQPVIQDDVSRDPVIEEIQPAPAQIPLESVPAPLPPPSPKPAVFSQSLSEWLYRLRICESGGDYQTNTGNGYYGAYQFSAATWNHWNTGYSRADLAPPSVQDATIVKNTKASKGGLASQNPGCYQKGGLSQFPPE